MLPGGICCPCVDFVLSKQLTGSCPHRGFVAPLVLQLVLHHLPAVGVLLCLMVVRCIGHGMGCVLASLHDLVLGSCSMLLGLVPLLLMDNCVIVLMGFDGSVCTPAYLLR